VNALDQALYKTRKTPLAVCRENDIEYVLDAEISLQQCADCSIWLKLGELIPDLDNQGICKDCWQHYGA